MELPQPHTKLDLPRIDQVGYVVRDLAMAVARYEPLFGPFTRLDTPLTGVWYRGIPTDVHLSIAFGHTGDIEIEFIQPMSGASPHTEFLAAGREGIHHVRYRVPDAHATIAALGTVGFAPIWRHDLGHAAFAYLEHASRDGVLVEVLAARVAKLTRRGEHTTDPLRCAATRAASTHDGRRDHIRTARA